MDKTLLDLYSDYLFSPTLAKTNDDAQIRVTRRLSVMAKRRDDLPTVGIVYLATARM